MPIRAPTIRPRPRPRSSRRLRVACRASVAAATRLPALTLALALAVGACAAPGLPSSQPPAQAAAIVDRAPPLPADVRAADIVLLGEVHDNALQHRLRLRWLEALADAHPIAIALEQFDADRQEALDRALSLEAQAPLPVSDAPARARRVAEAAGFDFDGWDWELYRPVIELALRRGLPLVAANLSAAETARVARGEVPAAPLAPGWSAGDAEAMRTSIREGHCGLLPENAVGAMADAQRTRDARLARAVADARARTGLPVVLLAGNGHLRRDIGVPRYLEALRPSDRIVSVALLESEGALQPEPFDRVLRTRAQPREDPCAALRRAWKNGTPR